MIRERLRNPRVMVGLFGGVIVVALALVFTHSYAPLTSSPETEAQLAAALALAQAQPPAEDALATSPPAPTPTATARPTPTPTPQPSPTATATPTPKPTPATPAPTRTPQPAAQTLRQRSQPVELASQSVARTVPPTPEPTSHPPNCLDAVYLSDVTIPDHTRLAKGETFLKTWQVRNNGTCTWPEDTRLVFFDGDQLSAPSDVAVGALADGETTELSVEMAAPDADGNFRGTWRLSGDDEPFGTLLTVVIQVGEGAPPIAAPSAAAPPPAAPPPPQGHIGGGFELGGQTHTLGHPDEMHHAGMTWVKFQHKWSPGQSPDEVAGRIQFAHANGFKVLLSIPGGSEYPTGIDFGGYVAFLGGVAALGPDGIEVWNEQNIDREWPAGTIDPGSYVNNILAPAYRAIKGANPDVLVISGAPAPTGYFGGCSGAGCDDAPYIAGMLAAGAAHYVDCVGVHYNEGILPPSQTSGDPRGSSGHYTRYFWGMVNTYWANFGGARPLCFTELGYVSPEGYGPLPVNFAWAANTTVAQQAAWLAEAAVLASSSGKVRLLIVYNVDFTHYDAHDPQAGYAIIRPGGGCPACETLHAVTH